MNLALMLVGCIGIAASLPFLWLSTMGFSGELADASVSENRQFGFQLLALAAALFLAGALALIAGLRSKHKSVSP